MKLTKKEQMVYDLLLDNVTLSRTEILVQAFGVHPEVAPRLATRSVDVTVGRLRKKLPESFQIESVRGIGYRLLVG